MAYKGTRSRSRNLLTIENPVATSDQPSSDSAEEDKSLTPELRIKVFGNDLIRDKIFSYVFPANHTWKKVAWKEVRSCRLVDDSWLNYVTRWLQKGGPFISIYSYEHWEKAKANQKDKPKSFQSHNFLDTWTRLSDAGSRMPSFSLNFWLSSYNVLAQKRLVKDLIKCLMFCGNSLNVLTLNLSRAPLSDGNISQMKFITNISKMGLPNLRKISLHLPHKDYNNNALINLLQNSILSGCERLTSLEIHRDWRMCGNPLKRLLSTEGQLSGKTDQLPSTLERLEIRVHVTSHLLANLLLKNSLGNLSEVLLDTKEDGLTDVISRILDRFSLQLKKFSLDGNLRSFTATKLSCLKFPVMSKLKYMRVIAYHSELEPEMEQSFPVLETLYLGKQTSSMMEEWSQGSHFGNVKKLTIEISTNCFNYPHVFTYKLSQQMPISFPNVQKLDLTIANWVEDGAMQSIFKHMTQITELIVRLHDAKEITGSSTWDAHLLGITPEYAKYIADTPRERWDLINLNHHRTPANSILNLSRLTRLELRTYTDEDDLLISDVSFHFAFLRMPILREMLLKGRFMASPEMYTEWENRHTNTY